RRHTRSKRDWSSDVCSSDLKGIRYVPMTEAVAACFRRIIANRKTPKVEPMVEGYAGFLFLDKNDMPMVALHWEKYMEHIIQKYRSEERRVGKEGRKSGRAVE